LERSKLIAKRIRDYGGFTVGKKDKYASGDQTLFKGWAKKRPPRYARAEDLVADDELASAAEKFLRGNPFALLFAAQLNMGKPAWKAWRGPYLVAHELGSKTMKVDAIAGLSQKKLESVLRKAKLGCRNLGYQKASSNVRALAKLVIERFGGKPECVWTTPQDFEELRDALCSLPGIGDGLANMTMMFLVKFGMVPQIPKTKAALMTLRLKPDTHVRHVFFRAGLVSKKTAAAVHAVAAELAPDVPASLDLGAFLIGQVFCHKGQKPECDECPIAAKSSGEKLCPRRKA